MPTLAWVLLLESESSVAGGLLGFRPRRSFSVYKTGWDPLYAQLGIGMALGAEAMRWAENQGVTTFDYLRGASRSQDRPGLHAEQRLFRHLGTGAVRSPPGIARAVGSRWDSTTLVAGLMKLMYVIPGMGGGGGAEKSLATMLPFWTSDIDVHIVSFSQREELRTVIESTGARFTNLGPVRRRQLPGAIAREIRNDRPDLVHTTLWEADVAGRLAALAMRVPVTSSLVQCQLWVRTSKARPPEPCHSRAQPGARRRICPCRSQVPRAHVPRRRRHGAPSTHRSERIEVIPRGRDPVALGRRSPERRNAARAALGIHDEPLVVAAARHERQKGLDVLIRAIPHVLTVAPNARFIIGGRSGTDTSLLHHLVAELGIAKCVDFIGPRDDVPELMCAADVFCVPSRWEGFGSVLVEAMALEVPTVASAIDPICEVGGPEPWLTLVPPDEPGRLAAGISELLMNPAMAMTKSGIGRERFENEYTAQAIAERLTGFFRRSIATSAWNRGEPMEP